MTSERERKISFLPLSRLFFSLPRSLSLSHTQEIWIKYSWSRLRFSYTHMLPHSSSLQWTEASIQLVWHSRVWQRAWQHPSAAAAVAYHCCHLYNHQMGHSKHAPLSLFLPPPFIVQIDLWCILQLPLLLNNLLQESEMSPSRAVIHWPGILIKSGHHAFASFQKL